MKYQDLVIKDGRFIGKFDKMYQLFEDPWSQSKDGFVENNLSRQTVINFIKKYNIKSIVEFGCGLGKTTNYIHELTGVDIFGVDISQTAISKSKKKYPNLNFKVDNVENIISYKDYNCYFFSEITWYILEEDKLNNIFKKMSNDLKGKYFIHNLVFYKGQQKYGNDYFSNLKEFIEFCPFKLIGKVEIDFDDADTIETSTLFKI